jgi:hypothetical protein
MNPRKPPRDRNRAPYWTAPRAAASARRRGPSLVEHAFALLQASRRMTAAMAEGPGIRPLSRAEKTQLLWSRVPAGPAYWSMPTDRFIRYRNLICIREGSPLCN